MTSIRERARAGLRRHPNLPWLESGTILLARVGSRAYGTALPASDDDWKGVAIPPVASFLGCGQRFEQAEGKDPDHAVYDIRKFMALAADCNPSIVEVLWVDPADLAVLTPLGDRIRRERRIFLSRKARHTFSGYAMSQLKRIQRHHRWLVDPPAAPPTRAAHGLPERTVIPADQLAAAQAAIKKKLDEWNGVRFLDALDPAARIETQARIEEYLTELRVASIDDLWRGAAGQIGMDSNMLAILDRERGYEAARREWRAFATWRAERNPERAALEARWGYDTKHATHLVRLLRMGREVLEQGRVIVRRPDAAELLEIRAGAWTYERLVAWAAAEDAALGEVAARSPLPRAPDRAAIDALCVEVVSDFHGLEPRGRAECRRS